MKTEARLNEFEGRLGSLQKAKERSDRRTRVVSAVAIAVAAMVPLIGRATPPAVPNTFAPSAPITAAGMNDNFGELENQISRRSGLYCGQTAPTTGAIPGEWVTVATRCRAAAGCSSTAHMCTLDEIMLSAQYSLTPSSDGWGWIATGARATAPEGMIQPECQGWSTTSGLSNAWYRNGAVQVVNALSCSTPTPIYCCD